MFKKLSKVLKTEDLRVIKNVLGETANWTEITEIFDNKYKSLLHFAVKYREYAVVAYLLDFHEFFKVLQEIKFDDLIHECIWAIRGNVEMGEEIFEEKCRIIQLLLLIRPDLINSKDSFQRTPLHVAVAWEFNNERQLELVQILMQNGADVNAKDHTGKTALHKAMGGERPSPHVLEMVKLIIANHADVDAVDKLRRTFLHLAANCFSPELFNDLVVYLDYIQETKCFKMVDSYGLSVLHYAVCQMEPLYETLKILKRNGVDFQARNDSGESIVKHAVKYGRSDAFLNKLIFMSLDI